MILSPILTVDILTVSKLFRIPTYRQAISYTDSVAQMRLSLTLTNDSND